MNNTVTLECFSSPAELQEPTSEAFRGSHLNNEVRKPAMPSAHSTGDRTVPEIVICFLNKNLSFLNC